MNNGTQLTSPVLEEMMDIQITREDKVIIVELAGNLVAASAPEAEDQILDLADHNARILLDMSNVKYMSSAGLRTLLMLHRKITENVGKIVLAGLTDEVRDVMAITGFLDFFDTVESRQEGLAKLR